MKRVEALIVVLLVLSGVSTASGQNGEIDSLEQIYNSATSDSTKFDALKTLCFKIVGIDSAKTEQYTSILIKEVEMCADPVEKADAYAAIGDYYNSKLDFANSLGYFQKSLRILKTAKGTRAKVAYAKCLLDYAYIFHVNGDFKTALSAYLEAESILDKYPEYDSRVAMYNRLSDVYSRINDPKKSSYYDAKAAAIADKIVSPKLKALYCVTATYGLDNQKDFEKIRLLLTRARMLAERNSLNELVWMATNAMGDVFASRNENELAEAEYKTALSYATKISNKYDQAITLQSFSEVLSAEGKHAEAERQMTFALNLAREINANALERDIFEVLSSMKEQEGDYKTAYKYLKLKEGEVYRVFDEDDQRQVNFLNAKYDAAARQAEIKRLTDEQKIQTLDIQRRKALTYYLSATLLLVLIVAFFVQRYYQARKKMAEQNNQIQAQRIKELENEKQLAAVQYALQGEENERSRLARDLHDGLGGLLSGAKMAFGSFKDNYLKNGEQADSFTHAFDLLGKSIHELQRVAHNMMPQALVNGTIKEALSEFCEKMNAGDSLTLMFHFFGREEKIPQKYQIAVYRIVQELVNNVIKHSGASEALVQLVQEKDRMSVVVQDNGRGFDPDKAQSSEGHGLKNIRTRIETLGGHFEIDSSIGKGSEISFEFENLSA